MATIDSLVEATIVGDNDLLLIDQGGEGKKLKKGNLKVDADNVPNANGGSVQDFIDAQHTTVAELATGKFLVGQYVRLTDRAMWLFSIRSGGTPDGLLILNAGNGNTAHAIPLLGTILTPEAAGAAGDLSKQDHIAVQACLDYFENNQIYGEVHVNKNYLCGDTIRGRSYASIVGGGLFKADAGLNKTVVDIYAAYPVRKIQNVKYQGFRIDGNKANQTTTDNLLGAGFALRCAVENPFTNGNPDGKGEIENIVVKDITSENCRRNNFYFGKTTFVTRGYEFSGLKGRGAVNGIYLADFCEYIAFRGVVMQSNEFGVLDDGSSNISFVGGMLANNTEAGIYFKTTGRNTSKKIVSGMHINHNKRGVWVGFGVGSVGVAIDHISIIGNHILANNRQGIIGSGGNDVIAKNNIFSGNSEESSGVYDDIFISASCRRWEVDNKHINSTGKTRSAVYYANGDASGAASHMYHRIDGTFQGYTVPINYLPFGNPVTTPIKANTNFIQGVFEYWNTAGNPPSDVAANANASVDLTKIPIGTICINNADTSGNERWLATKSTSSSGAGLGVIFKRVATYV